MELRYLAPFFQNLSTLLSFRCNVVRVLPLKLKKTARGGLDQDFHGPATGRVSVLYSQRLSFRNLWPVCKRFCMTRKKALDAVALLLVFDFLGVQGVTYGA